jgi:hypothetical protein
MVGAESQSEIEVLESARLAVCNILLPFDRSRNQFSFDTGSTPLADTVISV